MVHVRAVGLVVTAAIEVGQQLARIERTRVDRQQLEMRARGGRLHLAVPALEVLPPQLPLEHARARRQSLPDLWVAGGELVPDLPRRVRVHVLRRADRPRRGSTGTRSRNRHRGTRAATRSRRRLSPKPRLNGSGKSSAWKRVSGRVQWVASSIHTPGPGGGNPCSVTVVIVIVILDLLQARRVPAELVCQHTQRPSGGLARLDAVQPPLLAHRLPCRRAHEQVDDGQYPRAFLRLEPRRQLTHRAIEHTLPPVARPLAHSAAGP